MDSQRAFDDVAASLRSNWKFPAVVHFCRVFEGVLCLRQFSSEKFEAALLNPGDHSVFLSELISRLLYPGRKRNALNPETWPTWETNLLKKVKAHWCLTMDHNPLDGQQHFVEVTSLEKLEILYLLTEIALQNSAALRDTIRNTVEDPYLTADSVRCLPVGEDADGNRYFLFSLRYEDCRLYKQIRQLTDTSAKLDETEPHWATVTTTLEELKSFVEDFRQAKHSSEKKLHRYLSGILPEFERTERHRKKVEDRAALREQAPLLKRSSRLQEQAKRKEKARGQKTTGREVDLGDMRQDEGIVEETTNAFDLGISREERMRLRNQRRALAEKGRRVLTGKKRVLEYDGLTPLGASVQCPRKKRFQNVRPSRNITKLVSIIWEKFRRPMHHRKQFETYMEAAKKRRAAAIQHGKTDVLARWRLSQRPYEGIGAMRDARLPNQDLYRPGYVQQPSLIMNYLQQQRPIRSSYSFGGLQIPRPLQPAPEAPGQQLSVNPVLQQHTLMRYPTPLRDPQSNYVPTQRPPVLTDSLRRHIAQQQQSRAYDLANQHSVILGQRPIDQGMMGGDVRSVARAATFPPSYAQRLPEQGYVRSVRPYAHQEAHHGLTNSLNGLPGYPASIRSVQHHPVTNRLAPSLVQFPVAPAKVHWGMQVPSGNGSHELPKMPYAQPYLPQNPLSHRGAQMEGGRPQMPPFQFDNGHRWHATPQMQDHGGSGGQDPNGVLSSLFLKRKRND